MKIILHCPISDYGLLNAFVEACIENKTSLIAISGNESKYIEDLIDEIIVGDGSRGDRCICTSSHPVESIDDVIDFVQAFNVGKDDAITHVRL